MAASDSDDAPLVPRALLPLPESEDDAPLIRMAPPLAQADAAQIFVSELGDECCPNKAKRHVYLVTCSIRLAASAVSCIASTFRETPAVASSGSELKHSFRFSPWCVSVCRKC